MQFHTFGERGKPVMMLVHGTQMPWQMLRPLADIFADDYFIIVPALDGHEENKRSVFISVEKEAEKITEYILCHEQGKIDVLCGFSLGGVICSLVMEDGRADIGRLIMDGAPLVRVGEMMTAYMKSFYLKVTHGLQKRDCTTLKNLRTICPEEFTEDYLKIADNMSDETVINMITSVNSTPFPFGISKRNGKILYLCGTSVNEMLSRKSANILAKHCPKADIMKFKGCSHIQYAVFEPDRWAAAVSPFLKG